MRPVVTLAALLGACLAPLPARGDPPPGGRVVENRLATERSPYLRQHRTNPVDWHPWGPPALERAAREDRPIFLSVGYAACHWCHVMEHECFEDAATARLLNAAFVCVKVDREERPDLDRVYMTAVQLLTGRGGWPMTVLLTPDGRPFWGGTYLPRPALHELVARAGEAWRARRAALEQQADEIAERVRRTLAGPRLPPATGSDAEVLRSLEAGLAEAFDAEHGGYGEQPKFPPHAELLYALDQAALPAGARGLAQARLTLERMEEGGVHDQVGGGFHRYAVDRTWLVPHFEKMLYDNALLAQAYAGMFAVTREPRFARVVRRLLGWVERDLRRPGGGYASSRDADTEGHEGLTTTWTVAELRAALPPAQADLVERALGLEPGGNYDEEASGRPTGRNILHWPRSAAATAAALGLAEEELFARLDGALGALLAVRDRRPQPGLDEKEIAAWNGLLLSAFARAGEALAEPGWLERGRALARSLLERHRDAAGRLLRFPRDSGPEIPAFAEDLVHVAQGLLDLAEATGEPAFGDEARRLADDLLRRFHDEASGGFFATAEGAHEALLARAKEVWDSPIPSDNGTAALLLLRLSARTGEARYRAAADRTLAAYRPLLAHAGTARGVVGLARALALRTRLHDAAGGGEGAPPDGRVRQGVAALDLFLERAQAPPGSSLRFALRLRLDEGWHVNDAAAPAGRVSTALALAPEPAVGLGEVRWPAAQVVAPGAPPGWAGEVWIRGELRVAAEAALGARRVALRLTLQPCEAAACRPAEVLGVEAPLTVAPTPGPARHPSRFPP